MPDVPKFIAIICDADIYTKHQPVQLGRDVFTVADLEEMKRKEEMTYQTRTKTQRWRSGSELKS